MKIQHISIIACAFALIAATGFTSCSADYETDFDRKTLEVAHSDQANVVFQKEGGTKSIPVKTRNISEDDWTVTSNANWLQVTKAADGVTMTAAAYDKYLERSATVTIEYGAKQTYEIQVSQMGIESIIEVPEQNPYFTRNDQTFGYFSGYETDVDIPIKTNMNIDNIIVPDTVQWLKMTTDSTVDEATGLLHRKFVMEPNTTGDDRLCTIQFQSSSNWNKVCNVVIQQSATNYYVRPVYRENSTGVSAVDIAGNYRVPFQRSSTDGEYTISIPEEAKSWLTLENDKVVGSEIDFSTTLNTGEARSAVVTCTPTDQSKAFQFTVTQEAFQDVVPNGVSNVTGTPKDGAIGVSWTLPSFDKRNFTKIHVTAKSNSNTVDTLVDASTTSVDVGPTFQFAGDYTITVETVGAKGKVYSGTPSATSTSREWSETIPIPLTLDMLSCNSRQNGHDLQYAVDGSEDTYFQTSTSVGTDDKQPGRIDIHLKSPISSKFSIEFGQRKDNSNYDPTQVRVYGSNDGVKWTQLPDSPYRYSGNAGRRASMLDDYIDIEDDSYTYLRFQPKRRRNKPNQDLDASNNSSWAISELYLQLYHDEDWAKEHLVKK